MKTRLPRIVLSVLFMVAWSFQACVDQDAFDLDKLSKTTDLKPSFSLPLAKADLRLSDLIRPRKDTIEFDKNNDSLIRFKYRDDSIYSFEVSKVYKLPFTQKQINKNFNLGTVKFDNYTANRSVTVDDIIGQQETDPLLKAFFQNALAKPNTPLLSFGPWSGGSYKYTFNQNFKYIKFASGRINVTVTNNMPFEIELRLALKNIINDVVQPVSVGNLQFTKANQLNNIKAGETKTLWIDLAGKEMYKNVSCNLTSIYSPGTGTTPVTLKSADNFLVKVEIKDATLSSAVADIPLMSENEITDFKLVTAPERIDSIKLMAGKVNFSINTNIQSSFKVRLSFPATTLNNKPIAPIIIPISGSSTFTGEINLAGTVTKLSNSGTVFPMKYEAFGDQNTGDVTFNSTDNVTVNATVSQVDFDWVVGYFGKKTYPIPVEKINLDLNIFDKIDGGLYFIDPKFRVRYWNNIGIPVFLNLNLLGRSGTNATSNILINQSIKSAGKIGETKFDSITINNVSDFMALPPRTVDYSGAAVINNDNSGISNFVTRNGKVKIGIAFDVPFILKTSKLTIRDTGSVSVTSDDVENLVNTDIKMDYQTNIPFKTAIEVKFYNSKTKTEILSIAPKDANNQPVLLNAAETNADGSVKSAVSGTTYLTLTKEQVNRLPLADQVIIIGTITTNGQPAQLHGNAKLSIKMSMKTSLEIKL